MTAAGACACRSAAMRCASTLPARNSASAKRVASSGDAPADVSFAVAFGEVLRDLVDDVGLALRLQAQRREPRADLALPVMHVRAPVILRTASTNVSQVLICAASTRRPLAVTL